MSDTISGLSRRISGHAYDRETLEELSYIVEEAAEGADGADAVIELALGDAAPDTPEDVEDQIYIDIDESADLDDEAAVVSDDDQTVLMSDDELESLDDELDELAEGIDDDEEMDPIEEATVLHKNELLIL